MAARKSITPTTYSPVLEPKLQVLVEGMTVSYVPGARSESSPLVRLLPKWPDATRGMPNSILRSALFAVIERGGRRHMKAERIASLGNIDIFYTGEQLDQSDLDVWATLVHLARRQMLGETCFFTAHSLLKTLGKTSGGKNFEVLESQLSRLVASAVRIKVGRYSYEGSLIQEVGRDHETRRYQVVLNPRLRALFEPDQFTQVDWAVRRELARKPLAAWLAAFYASHAKPYPISVAKLRELCGSTTGRERDFKAKLKKALSVLSIVLKKHDQPFTGWIDEDDIVHVERTATRAQQKHLSKKPLL